MSLCSHPLLKMCDNLYNCCRICLDVESDHVSITDDPGIQLHLKSCLGITICNNTNLPRNICVSCVSKLNDFYNFQMNARCSQDWLESSIQEKCKKAAETKTPIQPLPDSEYNSDSLLEFLNNTANIEEYLSNLGKEDIPAIVNMLDKNSENSMDTVTRLTTLTNQLKPKMPSPKKRQVISKAKNCDISMEIDVLDSEIEIVKEILMKEVEPKNKTKNDEKPQHCFSCKAIFDTVQKLVQHLTTCEMAQRTCLNCNQLFDSKTKMVQHRLTHTVTLPTTCNCGKIFTKKLDLHNHYKDCFTDYTASFGCSYRCKQCSKTFTDRELLYKHAKEHIFKLEERICDICGHCFIGDTALLVHKKKNHGKPEDVTYRCKICSYTSKVHKEIYFHIMRHTKTSAPQCHLCESCGKSFTSRSTLIRHSTTHRRRISDNNQGLPTQMEDFYEQRKPEGDIENIMCERCGATVNNITLNLHTCVVKWKDK